MLPYWFYVITAPIFCLAIFAMAIAGYHRQRMKNEKERKEKLSTGIEIVDNLINKSEP